MTPTIIKGTVLGPPTAASEHDKPELYIEDPGFGIVKVPITRFLIKNLPEIIEGETLIITALCDADNRIIDALTVLRDASKQ